MRRPWSAYEYSLLWVTSLSLVEIARLIDRSPRAVNTQCVTLRKKGVAIPLRKKGMTTQQAYEKIREYFARPGVKLGRDDASQRCRYRTPDGSRCAVGALIRDEDYRPVLENYVLDRVRVLVPALAGVSASFLGEVQSLHDRLARERRPTTRFVGELDSLARAHRLQVVEST